MLDLTTAMLGLMVDAPDAPKDITAEKVDDATGKPEKPRQAVKPSLERAMERGKKLYMLGVNYRTSPIVIDEFNPSPQMGVNNAYGIVEEGVLHAGDRAPDAPGLVPIIASGLASVPDASRLSPLSLIGDGPRSSRLFDIFAPTYHTVLIFVPSLSAPEVQRVLAVLRRLDGDIAKLLVVLPSEGHSKPPVEDGTTVEQSATGELRTDDERQLAFEGGVLLDRDGHAYDAYIVERGSAKVVVVRPDGVVGAIVRGAEGLGRYLDGIFGAVGTNGA
ncbi:hypothetical protein ID866_1054 [Astraeus odoratus]|nr:hypothetical protein ID866_1054 [Astraeus odoratus]